MILPVARSGLPEKGKHLLHSESEVIILTHKFDSVTGRRNAAVRSENSMWIWRSPSRSRLKREIDHETRGGQDAATDWTSLE